jgi:peptide/nickel transport system substrate-binding protein
MRNHAAKAGWRRSGPAPVGRRRVLGGVAAGGIGLALAACGGSDSKQSAATPAAQQATPIGPKRGGQLVRDGNFERGFDPHVLPQTDTGLMGAFYSGLVRANPQTYDVEPDLAEKWELPSQTEIVFTLAPNIVWHDKAPVAGRALKPDDVVFSLKRVATDDPKFINKSFVAKIDKIETPDARTVKVTMKEPTASALSNLTAFGVKILAPEAVEAAKGNFASAQTVVGTGPFVLQRSEQNVGASLVRNPKYFKQGLPYLDSIEVKAFADSQAEWSAFLAGRLDIGYVPGSEAKKFESEKGKDYKLGWFADQFFDICMANVTKAPFNDARVTRAFRLLVDHDEFITGWAEVWFGRGKHTSVFPAALEAWDLTQDEYRQHLEWQRAKDAAIKEALDLLKAAGFTKDNPLKYVQGGINIDYQSAAAQLIQAQFRKNSQGAVVPEINLTENAAWASVRANRQFEYFTAGQAAGVSEPDAWFSTTFETNGGRNYGKMSDPQLDQLIAKQRRLLDVPERRKAVKEIILYMIDHSPYGSAAAHFILNATQRKVQGFVPEGDSIQWGDHYEAIWLDT